MKFHEVANLFPMMGETELAQLASDVKANGLREPIWLDAPKGLIIDGRNRFLACQKAKVTPTFRVWDGKGSLVAFVVSLNLHRRHLNQSQRDMVGARIASLSKGRPKENVQNCTITRLQAAEMLNVSERGIEQAKHVLREAVPDLVSAVDQGFITVDRAAKLSQAPAATQRAVVKRVEAGEKPTEAMRQIKREQLGDKVAALPKGKFRVIYADPPWQYNDSRGGIEGFEKTAAADHYPTMSVEELSALQVKDFTADDAVLFCWATFPLLPDALQVVKVWGFTYKTAFVWSKQRPNYGHYHRADAELLLVCVRGSCQPDAKLLPQQVQAIKKEGKHSAKPEDFRKLIDHLYTQGPRVELFRRGAAPKGWQVWGNEVTK